MKKTLILIGVVVSMLGLGMTSLQAKPAKPRKIAVQTYSLNRFTLEEAIQKLKGLDIDGIECYPGQKLSKDMGDKKFGPGMTAEEIEAVKGWLKDANLKIVNMGNYNFSWGDNDLRKAADFCREFGIGIIVTEAPVALHDAWEKKGDTPLCEGVILAVHNHGKGSSNQYWDPYVTAHLTKGKKFVKSNPDVGHWHREGIDAVKGLKTLKGTIASIHFKDVGEDRKDCVFGEGVMDVKGMLKELDSQKYDGWFVIEYENEWDNNVPSIKKCVEFLRKN